ncbi:hypothetical protein [Methanosarcina barkeri]|nr:hypothetical protein [Methanosarcina barkeri]
MLQVGHNLLVRHQDSEKTCNTQAENKIGSRFDENVPGFQENP